MRRRKKLEQSLFDFTHAVDQLTASLEAYAKTVEKNTEKIAELERAVKHE